MPSLLILIVDLHPLSWSLLSIPPSPQPSDPTLSPIIAKSLPSSLTLEEFITQLLVFLNAHLASQWGNRVVVYGVSAGKSRLLFPAPSTTRDDTNTPSGNVYEPFRLLDSGLEQGLRGMMSEEGAREGKGLNEPPALVAAMTKALCYLNRLSPSTATLQTTDTRMLIINATPGSSFSESDSSGGLRGGYVGLMNCVFAAQKGKIPIDVLTLPPSYTQTSPPIFLQQAAHLTGGMYWRWNGRGGVLQYLHVGSYISSRSTIFPRFHTQCSLFISSSSLPTFSVALYIFSPETIMANGEK
ncbi:hypothetical protein TREMEDRAFT_62112 [Tremella mesenterica DSM 1558]|uniref:uncharacterized protein n=1 Tax=Tremella mesenterica (strain ATCC 24925 / CBS 8224 / DSM 1558 / NBRC 9311 / NRRL Y-6157 / RJB 2259-6 / UBC 559-6) TaxID=578456 RepID=UPI0003F48CFD|nr:uncharacterized protein TREMEDRAFT_62112 [Tremella mesenterica DSM 1558]EIW69258.1 hypothetical protein TREMEDRAFT_62112 [Tremella mesenterica DSM 1558]